MSDFGRSGEGSASRGDAWRYVWLVLLALLVLSAVVYPREGALAIILAVCVLGLAVGALVFVVRRRHG